jgi:hypothetical protein
MAEMMFEDKGLRGDTTFIELPHPWVPLASDVISLEAPNMLREIMVLKNTSALYEIAYALYQYQDMLGSAGKLRGRGSWSCSIIDMLGRMRKEAGKGVPGRANDALDEIILIDRSVDLVSPMCTQLTYEGLLSELLGLEYGQIRGKPSLGAEMSNRKVSGLNEKDPIFREIRDKLFSGARIWVSTTLKEIQKFRDIDMASADVASLKGFVSDLKEKFSRMPLHTSLLEKIGIAISSPSFAARQKIEAAILDDGLDINDLYDRIYKQDNVYVVLRLLCLYSVANGGVPKKDFDVLRKDFLNAYGFEHLASLQALHMAGMFIKKEEKKPSMFAQSKTRMALLLDDAHAINEEDPEDIHYAYAGYAPLISRVVEYTCAESPVDVASIPSKDMIQSLDDDGYPCDVEIEIGASKSASMPRYSDLQRTSKDKNVLIMFVGGITHAEISTLRFLQAKGKIPNRFTIGTTMILNGSSMVKSIIEK